MLLACLVPAPSHGATLSPPNRAEVVRVSKRVTGRYWRAFVCIAYYESRWELSPPANGQSFGPWQIAKRYHPWLNVRRVTSSWLYAARAAWQVSGHGTDWSPWQGDRASCGV